MTHKIPFALAAILFSTFVAQVALSQSTQWRTVPDRSRKVPDKDAQLELAAFSDCVASRRYQSARAFVLLRYASKEQNAAFSSVVPRRSEDGCFQSSFEDVEMTIQPQVLAGAIAQALIRRDYADLALVIQSASTLEQPLVAEMSAGELFARCVVQADPATVLALIQSQPGSVAEASSVGALRPRLGPCLAAGSELTINRTFIRNITAVAAYRLADSVKPRSSGRTQ